MKIIQSVWTKPLFTGEASIDEGRYNGGWPHRKYNYYSIVFSALQLKKVFGSVELITDTLGKEILIDCLDAPFSKVHVVLDQLDHYDPALWALGKIKAYQLQNEPFLHIDCDVFLWKRIEDRVLNGRLIAQNKEANTSKFDSIFQLILDRVGIVPQFLQEHGPVKSLPFANAGILGGHDIEFFQDYADEIFKFLDDNNEGLQACISQKGFEATNINILFEQVFFYLLAKRKGIDVTYLFPGLNDNPPNIGYLHGQSVTDGYTHSFGSYKKLKAVHHLLEAKFRALYPSNYEKVNQMLDLCEI